MRKILISEHQLEKLSKNLLNEWSYIEKAYDETVDYLSGNQGKIPDVLQKGDGLVPTYLRGESGSIPGDQTDIKNAVSSQWDKFMDNFRDDWEPVDNKYTCIPNPELRAAVHTLIQNKDQLKKSSGIQSDSLFLTILKMAIGTLGRESDYGAADTFSDSAVLKFRTLPGGDTAWDAVEAIIEGPISSLRKRYYDGSGFPAKKSLGPAQFTAGAWKKYGLDKLVGEFDQVGKMLIALKGTYYRIAQDYKLALERGIGTDPSVNQIVKTRIDNKRTKWNVDNPNKKEKKMFTIDGTGNVSLDLAIVAHNMGQEKIQKYCKTNNPKYNGPCNSPNGIYEPKNGLRVKVDKNAWVPGYFPYFESGALTSIGYTEEVVKRAKGLGCVKL